jgi:hypothetical protein
MTDKTEKEVLARLDGNKPFASLSFYSEKPVYSEKPDTNEYIIAQCSDSFSQGMLRLEEFILCGKIKVQILFQNLEPGEIWIAVKEEK